MNARINLQALDALRGVLALYVVAGHARWLLWQGHAGWVASAPHVWWEDVLAYASAGLRFGHEAVMVFFVLSGFFIHLRGARQLAEKGQLRGLEVAGYARRRAHRLLPAYLLALLVTLALDTLGRQCWPSLYLAASGDAHLDQVFAKKGYSLASVLPALVVLPSSLGVDFGSNGPLWSLAFEAVFYCLYPLWLQARRRSMLVAYGVIPASCLLAAFGWLPGFLGSVWMHYAVWLAGAALAEWLLVLRKNHVRHGVAAFMGWACGFALHLGGDHLALHLIGNVAYGSCTVFLAASLPASMSGLWWLKGFEWLGVRSYSLYIMHFPWLVLVSAWVFDTWGRRPASGWLALTGFVSAIVFGCGCFAVCEKHFLHARLRLPGGLSA